MRGKARVHLGSAGMQLMELDRPHRLRKKQAGGSRRCVSCPGSFGQLHGGSLSPDLFCGLDTSSAPVHGI